MSIEDTTVKRTYLCDGLSNEYPIPFVYVEKADVKVEHYDFITGLVETLDYPTEYLVATDITTIALYPANDKITVYRWTPRTQSVELEEQGQISSTVIEGSMDRGTMIDQETHLNESRMLRVPITDGPVLEIPSASRRADTYAGYNSQGDPAVFAGLSYVYAKDVTDITLEPTGFRYPELVELTGTANRTIQITGTPEAYWRGVVVTPLASGYESSAHGTDTSKTYFLSYNGVSIAWAESLWAFNYLQIAVAKYDAINAQWYYIRECHGLMSWQNHLEFHTTVGTYKLSGGAISGYTLSSTTAAERRPDVASTTIMDEDLQSVCTPITAETYSRFSLTSTGVDNYVLSAADIVALSGNNPYYNSFTSPNWGQTLMPANSAATIWIYAQPVTADVTSQKYRYLFVQPQWVTLATNASPGALTTAVNEEDKRLSSELNIGGLLGAEIIAIAKIIIAYTSSNWTIRKVSQLLGTKYSQISTPPWSGSSAETFPIGMAAPYPATSIPTGWLKADGSIVNIVDYPDLFDVYGTLYGGNGTTTFGLPDLSGIGVSGSGTRTINGRTKGDATAVGGLREDQDQLVTGSFISRRFSGPTDNMLSVLSPFSSSSQTASEYYYSRESNVGNTQKITFDNSLSIRTGSETRESTMVITWCVKARHVLVDAYDDANLDQRVTDLEDEVSGTYSRFPKGHLVGMETRPGADADHDVIISVGERRSFLDLHNLVLTSELTKQIDATWVEGSGVGGMAPSLTVASNTTYHLYAIRNDSNGNVDVYFDTSSTAANKPGGWSSRRRLRSYTTDASANIIPTIQDGDDFRLKTSSQQYLNISTIPTTQTNIGLSSIPTGLIVEPNIGVGVYSTGSAFLNVGSPSDSMAAPVDRIATIQGTGTVCVNHPRVLTNTTAQIAIRGGGTWSGHWVSIVAYGWTDTRGRFGEE